MVTIITSTQLLTAWERGEFDPLLVVKVGTEQRVYGILKQNNIQIRAYAVVA